MRTTFFLAVAFAACAVSPADPVLATADPAVLDAFVAEAEATGRVPRAISQLEARTDAVAQWYSGRLHCMHASSLRATDAVAALRELDQAIVCFERAGAAEPAFADGCEQWLALCLGTKGVIAFAARDVDRAEEWLLGAVCSRPDQVNTPLGGGDTIKLGLLRLGDFLMRDFARTEALFRIAANAVGDDLDLLNNAAVYARDLGTRRERAGDAGGAAEMWERSYATYRRAVELAPHDVRLRNDCALVAIHHLRCDHDRCRAWLQSAIADGDVQLRSIPETDGQRRRDLDEAIGDCHENLALCHLQQGDAAVAHAAATASLRHFPFDRRAGARRHLDTATNLLRSP